MKKRPHDLKKSWFWHFLPFRPFHLCQQTFTGSAAALSGWKSPSDRCS